MIIAEVAVLFDHRHREMAVTFPVRLEVFERLEGGEQTSIRCLQGQVFDHLINSRIRWHFPQSTAVATRAGAATIDVGNESIATHAQIYQMWFTGRTRPKV